MMTENEILITVALFFIISVTCFLYFWYYITGRRKRNLEEFIRWAIERDYKEVKNKAKKEYKNYAIKNPVLTKEQVDRINKNMKEKN